MLYLFIDLKHSMDIELRACLTEDWDQVLSSIFGFFCCVTNQVIRAYNLFHNCNLSNRLTSLAFSHRKQILKMKLCTVFALLQQ